MSREQWRVTTQSVWSEAAVDGCSSAGGGGAAEIAGIARVERQEQTTVQYSVKTPCPSSPFHSIPLQGSIAPGHAFQSLLLLWRWCASMRRFLAEFTFFLYYYNTSFYYFWSFDQMLSYCRQVELLLVRALT